MKIIWWFLPWDKKALTPFNGISASGRFKMGCGKLTKMITPFVLIKNKAHYVALFLDAVNDLF